MSDVSDVSVAYDRIFNFVVFRNHLLHFYLSCPEHLHEGGPQEPPTLQQAVEGQRQLDRALEELGSQLIEELRVVFPEMSSRAGIFQYCVYTMFVQHPKIYVPVAYVSPAIPHSTVYASVCKDWNRSISRVVKHHNMLDFRHLWRCSQRRDIISYWVHGPFEDRFRFHAELIPELRLLTIRSPVK